MTSLALPPFLMTSEEGSFAKKTIENRKPLIIDQILQDEDVTPEIQDALLALKTEISAGTIQPLIEQTNDRPIWDHDLQPWLGKSWLEIPWFLAETYFYRRVLEAMHYFQPGPWQGRDPYRKMKAKEMTEALPLFTRLYKEMSLENSLASFQDACAKALWGNRADLSNLSDFKTDMKGQADAILRDDTAAVYAQLKQGPAHIVYFFDNGGKELYFDLALIDFLFINNLVTSVTVLLKNQPFFVSDVMIPDFDQALERLHASDADVVRQMAQRLTKAVQARDIQVEAPPFLATGRMYRQLPEALHAQIQAADLAILKGDVNYRRLVGDRHWDPTTSIGRAAGYFPISFMSLRTLKSELVVGLTKDQLARLEAEAEPNWQTNGNRGMITYLQK